jgi:hypothetical protein
LRASDQGFLPIQVEHYAMLLDWTGRELQADKRGAIPDHLATSMDRLGLNRSNWVETVRGFGRLFKQAAGRPSSLVDAAARRSRHWFQGKAAARIAFVWAAGSTASRKTDISITPLLKGRGHLARSTRCRAPFRQGEAQLLTSSDYAHTTVVSIRSPSNRLEAPRVCCSIVRTDEFMGVFASGKARERRK